MQIQRIQSLWLIIAFICALVSLCFPWIETGALSYGAESNPILLIIGLLATILPLIGLFTYRNLRRQKLITLIAALMAVLSLGYVVALSWLGPDPEVSVTLLAPCLMALSGIFDALARRAIISDEKLLKSADRLR